VAYQFKEQIEKQQQHFDYFVEWLRKRTNVLGVTVADREDDLRGIDLWVIVKDGCGAADCGRIRDPQRPLPIQVKVDFLMHQTGNMAVETVSQATYDGIWKPGWLSHLHATKLLSYICASSGQFRIYRSRDFWYHVMQNYNSYHSFCSLNGSQDGGEYWYGMGVKVPVLSMSEKTLDTGNLYRLDSGKQELVV
jgi:hypothetical protein